MERESTKPPTAEEFQAVLAQSRYTIGDLDTLKRVLGDAFLLYDVVSGSRRLGELLDRVEKKADPEVFSLIVFDLSRFLRPRLQKAVAEILELQDQDHAAILADSFAPVLERRLTAVQAVKQRIRELWAAAGITDTADMQTVEAEICRHIRSDAAAIGRVEDGDFGEVDRLFHERLSAPKGFVQ
jgi:hypothetical protein